MNITNSKCLPIAVILFLFLSISSCTDNDQNSFYKEKFRESSSDKKSIADNRLLDIENELSMVLETSRGISPERYNEITEMLKELEAKEVSPDRIKQINNLLSKLEVGGMKEEVSNNRIPDNKDLKFERIKNEITEINSKGVYLSANHSDRIKHELNYFKQRGYSADEIE